MARFPYFERLSAADKRIYLRSDALREVPIVDPGSFRPLVVELEAALEAGKRVRTAKAANALIRALCKQLGAPPVRVRVREVRPSWESGELHGLYTFGQGDGEPPETTAARSSEARVRSEATIEVWMRTVAHKRVVKFRTFLRTLLHEVVHHLDATIYEMKESFHTQGFFARESHLFRQLMAGAETETETESETETGSGSGPAGEQLSLFGEKKRR